MTSFQESELAAIRKSIIREACERDHLFFTRYFFKLRQGIKFKVNWHHVLICEEIEKVIRGETQNLVINVAPGSSKTELVVINLIARGLAINPRARFLHLSYSDDLASQNSSSARDIVQMDEYQELWPIKLRNDSSAKKRWSVNSGEIRLNAIAGSPIVSGSVYATALGGQITGFRAGHMAPGFQGAIIIDDPLKVEDAYSKTNRDKANRRLVSTVKSRKANPKTPIIIIMQRLAEEDPTGFIEKGNVPGVWRHVRIPSHIDDAYVQEHIPEHLWKLVDDSERDEAGMFSYWPYKEPVQELNELRAKDTYVYNGQYQQRPSALGGSLIKGEWFKRYEVPPPLMYRIITADTAQKTQERHDYSVFEHWGKGKEGEYVLLDLIRGKWEAAELKKRAKDFWIKCQGMNRIHGRGQLRKMFVEDKSSGTGLIQDLKKERPFIPVVGVPREKDKLTEWMDAIPHIEAQYVMIPAEAEWVADFISECESLTAQMTHAHDDQIDPMCDAIDLLNNNALGVWAELGRQARPTARKK